ncbi:glycosyltransferase [Piscirickettsia litoralis]|uniref:Glycosyltransferase 2-like domain-containing protein n=1 Tax=Piscirickettsia litoralis TaxID=1891921 RepID=A0ABX3A170_9GAMM|nr:glycosyltransferase family 2 protein [Piscirickettsia litoralis]ODN42198.1 hypothetical protein BGC07_03680 [Piscirickettsia litoralis]
MTNLYLSCLGIFLLIFMATLSIAGPIVTIALLSAILISSLAALQSTSTASTRFSYRYTLYFIGLSTLLTIMTSYFMLPNLSDLFQQNNSAIIGKIITLAFMPLVYQMYYKGILCVQYLFFKEPTLPECSDLDSANMPGCSMLIATRNEPFDVCKLTFDSANALIYPDDKKEIIVVDNSDLDHADYLLWKNYVEEHAKNNPKTSYKFIHRNGTEGFKPKNLDIAMEHISQDHVLLLDADSTLKKDTLLKVMPEFIKDNKLGYASLLIKGTNQECNFFSKICCISQNMLRYSMNLIGQTGFVIFQGHNSIWSKKTLEAIGPWLEMHKGEPMIVEDVAAAVRAYFKGFYGKSIWVESGEWVPTSLRECEAMWMRWTYGNMQITHKYIGKICRAATMSFKEKMDILNQMFSFSYILTPIFAILAIIQPHVSAFWLAFMVLTQLPSLLYVIGYSRHNKPKSVSWIKWVTHLYLAFFCHEHVY